MPVYDFQAWADNLEDVRLPLIEADILAVDAKLDQKVAELLFALDTHSAQILSAQESSDVAQVTADLALTNIYQAELDARIYTDQAIQNLRDELVARILSVGNVANETLEILSETETSALKTSLLADINAAVADALAMQAEIDSKLGQIENANDYILDTVLPEHIQDLADLSAELAEDKQQLQVLVANLGYETIVEGLDDLRIRADQPINQIRSAEDMIDDALLGVLDREFGISFLKKQGADAGIYTDPSTGLVRVAGVENLDHKISTAELAIDGANAEIALRATYTWVNQQISEAILDPTQIPWIEDLEVRIGGAEVTVDALSSQITAKADSAVVEGLNTRLGTAELDLDALEGEVLLRATAADLTATTERVTAVELQMATVDIPTISLAVQDIYSATEELDAAELQTLEDLLNGYKDRQTIREAMASSQIQMTAHVNEKFEAESTARIAVQASLDGFKASAATLYVSHVTLDEVVASATTSLKAAMEAPTGSIGLIQANLSTNYYTQAAADSAISKAVTALGSTIEDDLDAITSNLSINYYTKTTADTAMADAASLLRSQMEAPGGSVGLINANLSTNYYTKVQADSAISLSTTTLQSEFLIGTQVTDFSSGGKYWTSSPSGKPKDAAPTSGWTYLTAPDRARASVSAGNNTPVLRQKAVLGVSPGQAIDIHAQLYVTGTGTGTNGVRLYWSWLRTDYTLISTQSMDVLATPGAEANVTQQRVAPANAAWVRAGILVLGTGYSGAYTVDMRSLRCENTAASQTVKAYVNEYTYSKATADAAIAEKISELSSTVAGEEGAITLAMQAAQAASDKAGGKGKVFFQSTAPATSERLVQNLWIDTNGGNNTPKRWNGSAWIAVTDKIATDAAAAASAAQDDADLIRSDLTTYYKTWANTEIAVGAMLDELQAEYGNYHAEGLFRVSVKATPSGALSRISLKAAATDTEGDGRAAAIYLEARAGNQSYVIIDADRFVVTNGTETASGIPFSIQDGQVYIQDALIRNASISNAKIANGAITATKLTVTNLTNLCLDYDCVDEEYWSGGASRSLRDNSNANQGRKFVRINPVNPLTNTYSFGAHFPVEPESYYWAEAWGSNNASGGPTCYAQVELFSVAADGTTSLTRTITLGSWSGTAWAPYSTNFKTSSVEQRARIKFYRAGDSTSVYGRFSSPRVIRRNDGKLVVDGSIDTLKLDTDSFTAAGLSVFGGTLQSDNYVSGSSGWRITKNGAIEADSLTVRTAMIAQRATTNFRSASSGSMAFNGNAWITVTSLSFAPDSNAQIPVWFSISLFGNSFGGSEGEVYATRYRLVWRGTQIIYSFGPGAERTHTRVAVLSPGGTTTGTLSLQVAADDAGGSGSVNFADLVVGEMKR